MIRDFIAIDFASQRAWHRVMWDACNELFEEIFCPLLIIFTTLLSDYSEIIYIFAAGGCECAHARFAWLVQEPQFYYMNNQLNYVFIMTISIKAPSY